MPHSNIIAHYSGIASFVNYSWEYRNDNLVFTGDVYSPVKRISFAGNRMVPYPVRRIQFKMLKWKRSRPVLAVRSILNRPIYSSANK